MIDIKDIKAQAQSIEYLARIAYEAELKEFELARGLKLPNWDELSESYKKTAKAGVIAVIQALSKVDP